MDAKSESEFLGTVTIAEVSDQDWDINLFVNKKPSHLKLIVVLMSQLKVKWITVMLQATALY